MQAERSPSRRFRPSNLQNNKVTHSPYPQPAHNFPQTYAQTGHKNGHSVAHKVMHRPLTAFCTVLRAAYPQPFHINRRGAFSL